MPPADLGTIWHATPHTLAKIEILRGYLNAFFPILGRARPRRGQNILFVDGFAGPGEYSNAYEGSPIAALRAAAQAIAAQGDAWIAGDIECAFIEHDAERCANLRKRVAATPAHPRVKTQIIEKTFVEGIADLKRQNPRPFQSTEPLFVFIDPFGATGGPFQVVAEILSSPTSEVLINLDSDGIARNVKVPSSKARDELLTSVFGDESWRSQLSSGDFHTLCRQVLELYKQRLRSLFRVEYVFSFEMRGSKDALNYHLVFASQNPLGLEKMKEAMRAIDKSGSYSFSDGMIGQSVLFDFNAPKPFADKLHKFFYGQTVGYAPIKKFALNETPFINPIAMLKTLDDEGRIETNRFDPKSKSFAEEKVKSVQFLTSPRKNLSVRPVENQGGLFGN